MLASGSVFNGVAVGCQDESPTLKASCSQCQDPLLWPKDGRQRLVVSSERKPATKKIRAKNEGQGLFFNLGIVAFTLR